VRRHDGESGFSIFDGVFWFGKLRLRGQAQDGSDQGTQQSNGSFHG
jgi:hypothetical protein